MEMHGFLFPRTATGRSSLLPAPPWHYSGEMLTVEYRTDPDRVIELLPEEVEPFDDDPGAVALIFADWQSCSDSLEELVDPVRSQYKEAFFVIRCRYRGDPYSRCPFIWVDKDFALVRGYHQGYPKKLGEIWMTRPVNLGKAGPRLEPGGRFGATVSAYGQRLAKAAITLEAIADRPGFINSYPMLHNRWSPAIESDGTHSLDELVTMKGYDGAISDVWSGTADLELFDVAFDEFSTLRPREIIAGYYHRVATSWRAGTTLERG